MAMAVAEQDATDATAPTEQLFDAIRAGDQGRVEGALRKGASVRDTTICENSDVISAGTVSPLMLAVVERRPLIVKLLLERRANPNWTRPHNGATAAFIAVSRGHAVDEEMVKLLVDHGASVNLPMSHGNTLVFRAAMEGHLNMVRLLVELGAELETPDDIGRTPLFMAAKNGHMHVIRLLASLKADLVTTACDSGLTPLFISAYNTRFETTKTLLLLGAPVHVYDLMRYSDSHGDTRQLRTDLQAWAVEALAQHRTFCNTFLFGCSAHEGTLLAALGGMEEQRREIGAFVGIPTGVELARLRKFLADLEAIIWAAYDEEWPMSDDDSSSSSRPRSERRRRQWWRFGSCSGSGVTEAVNQR